MGRDVVVTASQKCLMAPPGSPVCFSKRAREKTRPLLLRLKSTMPTSEAGAPYTYDSCFTWTRPKYPGSRAERACRHLLMQDMVLAGYGPCEPLTEINVLLPQLRGCLPMQTFRAVGGVIRLLEGKPLCGEDFHVSHGNCDSLRHAYQPGGVKMSLDMPGAAAVRQRVWKQAQ